MEQFMRESLVLIKECEAQPHSVHMQFSATSAMLPTVIEFIYHVFTHPVPVPTKREWVLIKADLKKAYQKV